MKIHYFQRYHGKENVATANTMLLLSRLYSYSSDKFFHFLRSDIFLDSFEPEIVFNLQEKSIDSIPDATISQEGFKIIVETKLTDWFSVDQLMRHLKSFSDEKHKVIISLSSEKMDENKKLEFDNQLREYNKDQKYPVLHVNTTFELLTVAIQNVIDDRDYEMQDVLNDYLDYCYNDGLITVSDSWKFMRMQLAGTTFDFNVRENVYYDKAERGFRAHDYLGLYTNKSVRAIGKVCARITAVETSQGMKYKAEYGELTEERKEKIQKAIKDSISYGYDLKSIEHRYFFVEEFISTDFQKITPRAPMGSRVFNLTEVLALKELPDINTIAELLSTKSWT